MTEQDYKAMMSDSNPGRQQTTSTYQNHQPTRQSYWEQLGMTEQDYKAMMSDDNSTRQQRPASTYQKNQPARQINA